MIIQVAYNLMHKVVAWTITVVITIIIGSLFLRMAKKEKDNTLQKIHKNYGIFLIGWAIGRILFLFSDFERARDEGSFAYSQYLLIAYLVIITSITILVYDVESRIKQPPTFNLTKIFGIGLIGNFIFWIISIFIPEIHEFARYFSYVIGAIGGLIVFVYYLKIAIQTTGELRKRILFNLLALSLLFAGHTLDTNLISVFLLEIIWFPAVLSTIGVILFYISQRSVNS